jgi:hypothetical protein
MEEIAESGEQEEGELHHQQVRPAHFCNAAKAGGTRVQKKERSPCKCFPESERNDFLIFLPSEFADPEGFGPPGSGSVIVCTASAPDPSINKLRIFLSTSKKIMKTSGFCSMLTS